MKQYLISFISCLGICRLFCERMQTVELDTVYRTSDPEHLLFQSRICDRQPSKELLQEYFRGRHWDASLEACVARGIHRYLLLVPLVVVLLLLPLHHILLQVLQRLPLLLLLLRFIY